MLLFGKTDIGRVRSTNQDVYEFRKLDEDVWFGLVCDGMGGENGGQVASSIACETIYRMLSQNYRSGLSDEEYKNMIIAAVSEGNVAVYDKSIGNDQYMGMGTTVVLAVVIGDKAYIAHVGDSRVYLWKEEELYQVTKDHSIVQTLIDRGELMPEDAAHHPQKNMITRAVGVSRFVDIDFIEITNLEASGLLLCSDGLTNVCSDEEIKEVLLHTPPEEVCEVLTNRANEGGGFDNITIVYMKKD